MLPYFQVDSLLFGPLTIQVWGLLVSLGIAAAVGFAFFLARRHFLSGEVILDMSIWALISGLVWSRIFYILFYAPDYFLSYPLDIFKFWQGGASSLGGFFGAGLALWIFFRKRGFSWREALPYIDIGALSLWLGWGIGRLGCFFIHDHPGRLSDFWLAVNFPDGARHDLGLYDALLGFALFAIFFILFKYLIKIRWGLTAWLSVMAYAVVRFFLDFLRAADLGNSDLRIWILTPAQWGMLLILAVLIFLAFWTKIMTIERMSPFGRTPVGSKKIILFFGIMLLVVILVLTVRFVFGGPETEKNIRVFHPTSGEEIQSSYIVEGEARGNWYFEASFPYRLEDSAGRIIASGAATADGDWMTTNFVPFRFTLNYIAGEAKDGFLILQKDNPSGLPENDAFIKIPVRFAPQESMAVKVFFGNSVLDPGAMDCNRVFSVEKRVAKTSAVARATLEELLKGPSAEEEKAGYFTSLNSGVKIQRITIENGTAKVDFDDTLEWAVGGSCRVSAIRAQIVETLKQFSTVKNVIISINGRIEDILQP